MLSIISLYVIAANVNTAAKKNPKAEISPNYKKIHNKTFSYTSPHFQRLVKALEYHCHNTCFGLKL